MLKETLRRYIRGALSILASGRSQEDFEDREILTYADPTNSSPVTFGSQSSTEIPCPLALVNRIAPPNCGAFAEESGSRRRERALEIDKAGM